MRIRVAAVVAAFCIAIAPGCSDGTGSTARLTWTTASPADVGIVEDSLASANLHIRSTLPNVNAFLVVRFGKLVYERYYNGTSRNTLHSTRSETKAFVSALTGVAFQKG